MRNRQLCQSGQEAVEGLRKRPCPALVGGPDCISCLDHFPQKPKGMHWATYERLQEKCEQYEGLSLAMAYASIRRLQTRIQK